MVLVQIISAAISNPVLTLNTDMPSGRQASNICLPSHYSPYQLIGWGQVFVVIFCYYK